MKVPRQPSVGLFLPPVLISFVVLVLGTIVLLSGTGPQQQSLEPYHIIAINLSNFGHDLVPSPTKSSPKPEKTGGLFDSIVDDAKGLGQDISDNISDGIDTITDGLADKVTEKLGISEWFSLHITNTCEGMFAPNASSADAWYNITHCTPQQTRLRLDLGEILQQEINTGPLKLNLDKIPIPASVQDAIDIINDALFTLLVVYALGSTLAGLSFISSLATLILLRKKLSMFVVWVNSAVAGLGAVILLIGAGILTYLNDRGVKQINDSGKDVGISGIRGSKLITLSWISFILMLITSLYWGLATLKRVQRWIIIDSSPLRGEKTLPY
ncbi:actin cortical patch SUR7/pH-response regulator pali [Nemania sp. NC0429]|nr:actin cortical patch SUR7/pH-response regulator pali [Nemania sp. NC0429]